MNAGPAVQPLLRVRDVARLFDVQPETVRVWVRTRKLSAIRTPGGRGLRFRHDDVEALLRSGINENARPVIPAPDGP